MTKIKISDKIIGEREPCFIIAEAGGNHNGKVQLARKLIDAAKQADADAVKFQVFRAEALVTKTAKKAAYQERETGKGSQYEMLKKLELTESEFKQLAHYSERKNIIFLASAFDKESVDLLAELNVPAFKIPSGEIINFSLLKHIARKKKPIIMSTGMSTIAEIREAIRVVNSEGAKDIVLLHCVSDYPAKTEKVNLRAMETLRRTFRLPVGFSDHTLGIIAPVMAVALGAVVLEKHLTLDKKMPGPDHRASLEPAEFRQMVDTIRITKKAFGDGIKRPTNEEVELKKIVRRSVVAKVEIPKGSTITEKMLDVKRPGTGIAPKDIYKILGKKVKQTIEPDELITLQKLKK